MKKKVLIFGSGSIGTHHTNAAISLDCDVYVTDKKFSQLQNMKDNIYPQRYGHWNNQINLIPYKQVFLLKYYFDLVIIGVPPKNHLPLIKLCEKYLKFKKILVEKPLCVYNQNFSFLNYGKLKNKVFCGFNHSISPSFLFFLYVVKKKLINKKPRVNINIEWKESFDLILKAHPWIKSIRDSYLSNYKIGGGVCHEYSHAIHLFIIFKEILFNNNSPKFKKKIKFKKAGKFKYDNDLQLTYYDKFKTLNLFINSKNDPAVKKIDINQNEKKFLIWNRLIEKKKEICSIYAPKKKNIVFSTNRRMDFINELKLLLINNKKSDIKYLKLEYAVKVNNLLKKIYKTNV